VTPSQNGPHGEYSPLF